MKRYSVLILVFMMLGLVAPAMLTNCTVAQASGGEEQLNSVLTKIETTSRSLTSLQAEIVHQRTNGQLNIKDPEQAGTLLYKPGTQRKVRIDYSRPQKKVLSVDGNKALLWEIEQGTVFETGLSQIAKKSGGFDLLTVLNAAAQLRERFNISLVGNETVDGQAATHLTLTPKTAEIKFARIEVWIDHKTWLPAKQVFFEKNRDYTEVRLTRLRVNPGISDNQFKVNYGNAKKVST
ncbi:MAG: outer membrane lipoprotein carrier protein LolA [Blastocatellia bacterium]|nr:outer membrane lipoprotein carrier protein LolA [Blastocatellia bacterium]